MLTPRTRKQGGITMKIKEFKKELNKIWDRYKIEEEIEQILSNVLK